MEANGAAYAAGRELIRIVCENNVDELENIVMWIIWKEIAWTSISCIVTFPDRTYKLLNYATWSFKWRKRWKKLWSDFVESLCETENFKSFLLDVNDVERHALFGKFGKFLEKLTLWENHDDSQLAEKFTKWEFSFC